VRIGERWGGEERVRDVRWPLTVRVGRVLTDGGA
jgi:hypothetical protein